MKKYLFCTLLFFCFASSLYAQTGQKIDTPGKAIFVMATPGELIIHTKEDTLKKGHTTIYSQYPHLEGIANKKVQRTLNNYFKKENTKFRKEMLKLLTIQQKNYSEDIPYTFSQNFNIANLSNDYLVIGFFKHAYMGGNQSLGQQTYINVDLTTGSVLKLENLFKKDSNYEAYINMLIKEEIKNRVAKGEVFLLEDNGFKGISETQIFYKDKENNLIILFNVYEIAPYESGIIKFVLPQEKLSTLYI